MKGLKKLISIIALIILIGTDFLNPISYALEQEDKIFGSKEDINLENNMEEEYTNESSEENLKNLEEDMIEKEEIENNSSKSEDNIDEKINETLENEDNSFGENDSENEEEIYKSLEESSYIEKENLDESLLSSDEVGLSGENNTKGELDILEGVELSPIELVSDSIVDVEEEIIIKRTIELATAREILNEEEIIGQETYKNILVNVQAPAGTFPEGVELRISPITTKNEIKEIKEQIVDSQDNIEEEPELVAFDIAFLYTLSDGTEVELQPKDGESVQVTFDYSNNKIFKKAEVDDSQTIEVYHINDKNENGEKVEKGEEVVEKIEINQNASEEIDNALVIDAENFSIYVLTLTPTDTFTLTLDPGAGRIVTGNNIIVDENSGTGTIQDVNGEVVLPAARRANYLLSGWYTQLDEYIGNAGSGYNVTENITLYAQWKCDINQGYNDDGHGGCVATSKDILAQMPGFTYGTDYEISITRPASLSGDDSYADSPVTYTIMDRNLGATSNDISSTDSYGYYYQYGNNYGFNWLPESVWKYDDMYGNIDLSSYGPSNPFYQGPYFIKGRAYAEADYEDDWATVSNIGIWGGNAIKESNRKGPCPEGYHIPTQKEWIDLEAYYVETYGSDTEDFRTYFKLPLPGSLARSTALGEKNYGTEGFYRTTSLVHTASGYNAYAFKVKSGEDNSTYANNRVNGYSIRCFKNDDTIYTVTYNDGVNDEEVFNQLGTGYRGDYFPDFVGEPEWIGKTFKGWFMESDGDYIHVNPSTVQITSNLTVYAKWSSCAEGKCVVPAEEIITGYGDLDIYFVENDDANTTRHYTTLDRDVGASQLGVAGYQYQWGNNHGFKACTTSKCNSFPGGEIPNSNQVDISGYDPITNPYNSETYIKQSTKDANWATGNVNRKDNLWGGISGTNAAMQGPCPNGYHIPTSGDWEDIYASWSDINFGRDGCKNGSLKTCATKLVEDLLLTPHGRRDHEAKVDYLTAASYWSSSPVSSSTTAYGVYLNDQEKTDSKAVQISNIDGRIRARAVRCVKNEYNTPLIIKINGGTGASLSVYSGSLHYLTNPTKEGYEFSGWYSNLTGNVKIEDGSTLPQGTTTLYAKWIGNNEAEYIFNASGGTFSSTATEELVHIYTLNDVINSEDIEIPVRSGFDFAGWYDELGNLFEFPLTATGNLNLYAHWNATTAVNVTVNYRLKDLDVEHNVLTGTSTVYVSGVIFTGLADDIVNISTKYGTGINGYEYSKSIVYGSDFSGGVETEITTVLGDGSRVIDMYYIPKKYDFTLNSASYSSTGGSSESTGYYYGANVTLSGDSSDDCFSWSGWTTSGITLSDSTLPQTWFTMPANDVEVTPSVTEKTYNIIFSGNGSTSGEMNPINGVMCTQSIQLTQNAFEKTSYIFTGWSRNSGSNTREYTDRQTVSGLSKTNLDDVVLYAVWDRNDFEVRIVSNNESYGTVSSGLVTKPYGTPIVENGNTLSIGGTTVAATAGTAQAGHTYTFSGWIFSSECGNEGNYAVAEGCAITGNFEDEINSYEVTWKNWNNAILATRMVTYGDHPVYTGADPKRSREDPAESEYDFIFTGWTKNGDSQIIKDLSTEVVTGTVTYTAHYDQVYRNYIVKYNANGGLGTMQDQDLQLHTSGTLATNTFEKLGYNFAGWLSQSGGVSYTDGQEINLSINDVESSILTDDLFLNLQAQWTPKTDIKVTVNYYLKKIDPANNILIDGVDVYLTGVEYTGTSDSTVNIFSKYWTGIVGYDYDNATVFSGGERTGATETTVLPDGSREINMYYIPHKYNFTLNSDSYSSTAGSSESTGYYYGATVTLSGDSNDDCFMWSGWTTSGITLSDATLHQTGFAMPANAVEVTPSVREKIYNIIFNGNGNTSGEMLPMNGVKCTESTGLTLSIFEKKGYTFTGWSTISGDNIREYTDGQIVSGLSKNDLENVNLYAVWDINWYTVTFDLNGGFLTGDMTETTGYTIKTPSISLENYIPIKSGYTLIGWYKGDTLVDHIAGGEIGDYILDAHWKADSDTLYTVKYYKENLNGGYDVWTGIYIGETDIEITALVKDFTGFTYSGGNENNVTTGVIAGDGSLVLKLYYDRNKYPIIWKDGNGETLKTENLFYEMIPEYTGNIPTKTKTPQYTYIFNDKWLPNIESVTTGATYMAQFDAIVNSYTINIVPNNTDFGTISTGEINVEYGVTIVESGNKMIIGEIEIEANPNPADIQYTYEFDNWTNTCGQKLIGTCTLQANFKRILNKYTITWRNEDGSVIDATQVEYGKKPTHTNPTKSDTEDYRYIFVGWTPEILPVIGNAEYTAIFKPEEKEKSGGGGMSGGGRKGNDVDSQHGSAEENVGGNEYIGEEVLDDFNNNIVPLYKWSYENKITTINTLEEANPDGLVTRGHLAKMVVNYMINVLGRKVPYDVTYNCVHRGDNESSRKSDEIRDYATKACAFGVMGINMENNEFLPNNIVTRAEFGTVISRMLRGDKYDIIDTNNKRYYENHLQVLKKDDILTQISNPEARWEIRIWVWLVFRRIIEKKK